MSQIGQGLTKEKSRNPENEIHTDSKGEGQRDEQRDIEKKSTKGQKPQT